MPRLVGLNHIALEVDDIDEALAFWESIFGPLQLRGRGRQMAFIDMGDQFEEVVRARLQKLGIPVSSGRGLDFRDPWGNLIQVVDYRDVQFTKTDDVLRTMGLDGIEKSENALAELRAKGISQ